MELRGKTVFVTGANGFVGTYVAERLVKEGLRVRALVRSPEAAAELQRRGVEAILGELTDKDALPAAARGADLVVHCAATGAHDLEEARRVNVEATATLAEAALAEGCERFVHISTVGVYPLREREGVLDEDSPMVTGGDAYSVTKAEGEQVVSAAAARGLRAVILRPAVILGVHPSSFWGTVFPKQIAAGQFVHVDEGQTRLGYLHISTLVEAVVRALQTDDERVIGQVFNIVDGHATWESYTRHFRKSPLPSVSSDRVPGFFSFRGSYATEKAERLLGLAPRDVFEASLEEIVRALPQA